MNFRVSARNISNITVAICLVKLSQNALRRNLVVQACCSSELPHCNNNYKLKSNFLLRLHNRKPIRLPTSVPDQHCRKEKFVYIVGADCRVNMEPETSPEPLVSTSQHADCKVPRTAGIYLHKVPTTAGIRIHNTHTCTLRSSKPLLSTYKHGVATQNCTHCRENIKPLVLHITLSKGKGIFTLKQKHQCLPPYPLICESTQQSTVERK